MDIDLQPLPALTYTTIGGIIDLYIFTGPTVQNVIEQYWAVIGVRVVGEMMTLSTVVLIVLETYVATLLVTWISSLSIWIQQHR